MKLVGSVSEIVTPVAALRLAAFETTIEWLAFTPFGPLLTLAVLVVFKTFRTGTHCAPELTPGACVCVMETA